MSDKSEPAFPTSPFTQPSGDFCWPQNGLTKREWFAGMALQAVIAGEPRKDIRDIGGLVKEAFCFADMMLMESVKP